MANQPLPSRPWLILGSMRSVAPPPAPSPAPEAASPAPEAASPAPEAQPQAQAQAQAQPPAPRPIFRPTFGQAFRPTTQQQPPQPQPEAQAQPPAPRPIFRPTFGQAFRPTTQQQPPQPPTAATAALPFQVGNVSSVPSNPSQKIKPPSPPPSALTLPPAHVKSTSEPIDQKILLIEKPNPPFKPFNGILQRNVDDTAMPSLFPNYEKREQTMDLGSKDHKGKHEKANSEDASTEVITMAGDSKGAILMELSPASKKHEPEGNTNKLTKTNPKTWWGSKFGSDEEKLKRMVKIQNKMGIPSPSMNAFINSNVQAVTNSILVNTSCTNHDPGVHVFFSRGGGRGLHLKDCGDAQNN